MAQINNPQIRQKDDALTTIMKGLQIASSVYGIKTDIAKLDEMAKEREGKDNLAAGKYDKNQQLGLAEKFNVSNTAPANMAGVQQGSDLASGSPLYMSLREKAKSPLLRNIAGMKDGKAGTYVKDYASGQAVDVDFVESPAAGVAHWRKLRDGTEIGVDRNGNEVTRNADTTVAPSKAKGAAVPLGISHWERMQDGTVQGFDKFGKPVTKIEGVATRGASRTDAEQAFRNLPRESQREIDKLSTTAAAQLAIANTLDKQLENVIKNWADGDKKQALITGDQMLKAINSEFGPDALGKEESERLGGLLQPNLLPNPLKGEKFGVDVPGFIKQVRQKSNAIKQAIQANRSRIKDLYDGKFQDAPQLNEDGIIPRFGENKQRGLENTAIADPIAPQQDTFSSAAGAGPAAPKVGEVRKMGDGSMARWDGSKFVEVQEAP